MNMLSPLKALACLLRCGHFLYTAKKIVSAVTIITALGLSLFCIFRDKKTAKRLISKLKAVM